MGTSGQSVSTQPVVRCVRDHLGGMVLGRWKRLAVVTGFALIVGVITKNDCAMCSRTSRARALPNGDDEWRADEMSPRWIAKRDI